MRGSGFFTNVLLILSTAIFLGGLFGDVLCFSLQPSVQKCLIFTLLPGHSVIFGSTAFGAISPLRMLFLGSSVVMAIMSVWFAWCAYARGLAARNEEDER